MTWLSRREWLELSLSGLALARLTGCAAEDALAPSVDTGPELPRRVPGSLLRSNAAELDVDLRVISGRVPSDLYGHVFMTAPVPAGDGSHVFNGEGMLYRLDLGAGSTGVALRSRLLRTHDYYVDRAVAGTDAAFRNLGMGRLSGQLGFRSMPNTTPVAFGGGRLLAAVDASRPWEVDPVSLQVATPIGALAEWTPSLPPSLFSGPFQPVFTPAHPFYDEHTGELFAVNYTLPLPGAQPYSALVRWDGSGALHTYALALPDGGPVSFAQTAHQITGTRDYLLIIDTAFLIEGEQAIGMDVSRPQASDTVIYAVRRAELTGTGGQVEARRIVIPREAAHVVADYDNDGSRITLHLAHLTATDLSEWLRPDDVLAADGASVRQDLLGMFCGAADRNALGRHVVDGDTGAVLDSAFVDDDELTWATLLYQHRGQMPHARFEHMYYASFGFHAELLTRRVRDLYVDYPHRVVPVDALPFADGRPGALVRLDVADLRIADGYRLPAGRVLSSPQFAPRAGRDGATDGYLVCTVSSDDASTPGSTGDEIWMFDAADLARGPLVRLAHPELDFGFTIHTTWTEAIATRTAGYEIRARDDYADAVAALSPALQQVFEDEVYPRFGG